MSFDVNETIQSQYSTSPILIEIINNVYKLISPQADFDLFYQNIFDVRTAVGWGLDVWGRIVGATRDIVTSDTVNDYLGFNNTVIENIDNFNNAPFYQAAVSQTYTLEDNAYRLVVMSKAMANISGGSLYEINKIMMQLLPDYDVAVIKVDTMQLRILIHDYISDWQEEAFLRLALIPAGVGYEVYTLDPHTFGFNGSGLEPFNQGVFSLKGAPVQNAS